MNEPDAKRQLWRDLPEEMRPENINKKTITVKELLGLYYRLAAEYALTQTAGKLFAAKWSSGYDIIKALHAELDKLKPRPKVERTAL